MNYTFVYDERLSIKLPVFEVEWEALDLSEREAVLAAWEDIRGSIPDRVKEREDRINQKQARLNQEDDFEVSCALNWEIAELASQINDLHLWYRVNQDLGDGSKPHS